VYEKSLPVWDRKKKKMKARDILNSVVDFLTSSPFEIVEEEREELSDLEKMKAIKLFRKTKEYYMHRCINDYERLAEELAKRDIKEVILDKNKINFLYSRMKSLQA
jgi:hypothetical protein